MQTLEFLIHSLHMNILSYSHLKGVNIMVKNI